METKLARISLLSTENPDMVCTSLGHLINKEMLKSCHAQMDGTKAVGIDGITKEEYGRRLEENISAGSVSGFEILLPGISVQNKIANILSAIDSKIELNNQINHNLAS